MIVFVEGADGSGKSTLVGELSKNYPIIYVSRKSQNDWTQIWIELQKAAVSHVIVADRCFISDYVYRLNDGEKGDYNIYSVLALLKCACVIYCKTDTQFDDAMERGEDNITQRSVADDISNLYDVVMRILKKEGVNVMNYNWKEQNVDDVLNFIKLMKGDEL